MRKVKNKIVVGVECVSTFHYKPADCDYIIHVYDNQVSTLLQHVAHLGLEIEKILVGCESGVDF